MRDVRRFYFYAVSFISLQVVLWGVITLLSSTIDAPVGGGLATFLARGLSQILVGLPIFFLHWSVIRRDLEKDPEEHRTLIRAIFSYGLSLAALVPVFTNLHAILRRLLFNGLDIFPVYQNILAGPSFSDNLIAILANLLIFYFAVRLLKADWQVFPQSENLENVRRLYRYIWFAISLVSLVTGLQQVISSVLYFPEGLGNFSGLKLANGVSVTLIAAGIWAVISRRIQESLGSPRESLSLLRTVVLFVTVIGAIALTLSSTGVIIYRSLRWLLGESQTFNTFLNTASPWIAMLIPVLVVWLYYYSHLRQRFTLEPNPLSRAALVRLFYSILALATNGVVFYGLWSLLRLTVDITGGVSIANSGFRNSLSAGASMLAAALPLWMKTWPPLQREATAADECADHARQSVVRKAYLYLVVFSAVVGLMAAGGFLAYRLINAALGNPLDELGNFVFRQILLLTQIVVWLIYHLRVLQADGRAAQDTLHEQHAAFSTAFLTDDPEGPFAQQLTNLVNRQLPNIPFSVLSFDETAPASIPPGTAALILSSSLAVRSPLTETFEGKVIVLPQSTDSITWVGVSSAAADDNILRETVRVIRQLAEGQTPKPSASSGPWVTVGYVLGVIFALQILAVLLVLLISAVS